MVMTVTSESKLLTSVSEAGEGGELVKLLSAPREQ